MRQVVYGATVLFVLSTLLFEEGILPFVEFVRQLDDPTVE